MTDLKRPRRWHKPEDRVGLLQAIAMIPVVLGVGYAIVFCSYMLGLLLLDVSPFLWWTPIPIAALLLGAILIVSARHRRGKRPVLSKDEDDPVP